MIFPETEYCTQSLAFSPEVGMGGETGCQSLHNGNEKILVRKFHFRGLTGIFPAVSFIVVLVRVLHLQRGGWVKLFRYA